MSTVSMAADLPRPRSAWERRLDRLGAIASATCAMHCLATPFLLLLVPAVGHAWADPSVHWLLALLVIPLAGWVLLRGYRRHGSRPVAAAALIGIALILVGLVLPALQPATADARQATSDPSHASPQPTPAASSGHGDQACQDTCCPTIARDENGQAYLHLPPGSLTTLLGSFFLIAAHVQNFRLGGFCAHASHPRHL